MCKKKSFRCWVQNLLFSMTIFTCLVLLGDEAFSQPLARGRDKFLGGWTSYNIWMGFDSYWNQVTPGNEGKWGSVEGTQDLYSWNGLDAIYNYAISRGLLYKHHTLIWGQQQPGWIITLDSANQRAEVQEWIQAVGARYPKMDFVDVVNEPFHAPPSYANAIGGAGSTGWDWVIQAFTWARQYCAPGVKLILNEYNILQDDDVTTNYIRLIDTLMVRGLIDGIGVQGHYFEFRSHIDATQNTYVYNIATLSANLNRLTATGLPVYITEFDIDEADDTNQLTSMQIYFPLFWDNPGVKGISMSGYRQGDVWADHPYTYLILSDDSERPALDWLRTYVESGNIRSNRTGDWNELTSWEQSNGTTWLNPVAHIPTFADGPIAIKNGDIISVTVPDTVDQVAVASGGILVVNSSGTFVVKNGLGEDLSVTGTIINLGSIVLGDSAAINFTNGGIYKHEQDGGSIPIATWKTGSTCEITGVTVGVPSNITQNFYNFTWDCPSQNADLSVGWQNGATIEGTLTVTNTNWDHASTLSPAYQFRLCDGSGSCTINNIVVNGYNAVLTAQGSSYADTVNVNGNITLSGGGMLSLSNDIGGVTNYYVKGNFAVSDSAYIGKSNSGNTSKFIFNRAGIQNLTLPSSGVTFFGAPNITVNSGTTLNIGTSAFGGTGSFQLQPGATMQTAHANGVDGNIICTGAYGGGNLLSKAANYTFNGSTVQSTGNSLPDTVGNLTLNNSSGLTLSRNVVVDSILDMQLGTLSGGGKVLSYGLDGTLKYSSTTTSQITTGVVFPASSGPRNFITTNAIYDVTLHASRAILGNLSLSGKLIVGANTITAGSVTTSSITSAYVNTSGGGALKLSSIGSTQVLFPIGTTTYAPLWIINTGVVDTISAGVIADGSTSPARVRLKWNINESVEGGGDYTLQFGWNPNGTTWENNLFKSNRPGNARIFLLTTDTLEAGTGAYTFNFNLSNPPLTVSRSGITTLGPFAVGKFRDSVTFVDDNSGVLPVEFRLSQNYPNPFNPTTKIEYALPQAEFVTLKVYNLLGQLVATLVDKQQVVGKYTIPFDGGNLASGIYIYRLTAGTNVMVKKMCLIK